MNCCADKCAEFKTLRPKVCASDKTLTPGKTPTPGGPTVEIVAPKSGTVSARVPKFYLIAKKYECPARIPCTKNDDCKDYTPMSRCGQIDYSGITMTAAGKANFAEQFIKLKNTG